jgi:dTDP-4-amino-4,6-dideoxygalactose transaminase
VRRRSCGGREQRTTALVAAIEALQPEPGDELVTSPFTFVATVNAALEAGLTVRFADIDAETFCVERPARAPSPTQPGDAGAPRLCPCARLTRDELMGALRSRGVGSGVYYPRACYDYPCYREDPRVIIDEVPVVEQVAGEVLSLPVHL